MALTNPDYSGYKTLSQYVNQLAYIKKQYTAGNTAWATDQAAKLRMQAVVNGFDLKVLEKEALIKTGADPEKINWADFEKNTNAPFVAAQSLATLKKQYANKEISRDILNEQAQKLRLDAAYTGLDLNLLELRAGMLADPNKKEPAASYLTAAAADIKMAEIAAKLLKNAEYYKRIGEDKTLTDAQKKWYQNQVHNDSQNLRTDALKAGINLWELEKLFTPYVTGRAWSQADYNNAKTYIDNLYKAAGKDPSGVAVPNFSSGGTKNDYSFKKPIVKRTTFGETFSGADMVVYFAFPGHMPIEVGVATTVSVTSYREKKQFRTIGRITPRGITKGPRTVSGKIIFTVIKEHIVETLKTTIPYLNDYSTLKFDELPSFDVMVSMGNEYGGAATMVINGVTTVDEQKTLSIEELFTENIFTYLARDYQPLRETQKSKWAKYDPQEWYSYKLREKGSELIGKFKIDELLLSENAADFAKSLPAAGFTEEWTKLQAGDIAQLYYNTTTPIEHTPQGLTDLTTDTIIHRGLFLQALDGNGSPIRNGSWTVTFAKSAYDGVNNEPTRDYTTDLGDYDFIKSGSKKSGDNKYYGMLILPQGGAPQGITYTIKFTATNTGGKSWSFSGTGVVGASLSDYKAIKPKLVDSSTVPTVPAQFNAGAGVGRVNTYYDFDAKVNTGLPNKVDLTAGNIRTKIASKSVNGSEVLEMSVMRGLTPVVGQEIYITWSLWIDYLVSDPVERPKADLIDKKALESITATRYYLGLDYRILTTDSNGRNNNWSLEELLYWKSTKTASNGKKAMLKFSQLPSGAVVKIFAQTTIDGQKHYLQWMVRKVSSDRDA